MAALRPLSGRLGNWRAYLKAVTYSGLRQRQSCRRNLQAPPVIELIILLHCSEKLATS